MSIGELLLWFGIGNGNGERMCSFGEGLIIKI
jgi:hypothetical protein